MLSQLLDPTTIPHWNDLLISKFSYPFFLTREWAQVMSTVYQYTPKYLAALENNDLTSLLPVMEVNSPLTGIRGVSLPFTDMCEILSNDPQAVQEILHMLETHAQGRRWKYIEFRNGDILDENHVATEQVIHHTLDLTPGFETLHAKFRSRAKRHINKARANDIRVIQSQSAESLDDFYHIHCQTRKHHGVPPQPIRFFRSIHDLVLKQNMGWIFKAVHQNKTVSACVYFHFDKGAIYKFGATSQADSQLGASYLIMNDAIQWYAEHNYSRFSFGRTDLSGKGLLQFKDSWGAERNDLIYYRHYLHNRPVRREQVIHSSGLSTRIFQRTPIPILRLIGELAYKHMG